MTVWIGLPNPLHMWYARSHGGRRERELDPRACDPKGRCGWTVMKTVHVGSND